MKDSILIVENYPGRGDCIARLLRQFDVPFELVHLGGSPLALPPRAVGVILSGGPQSVTKLSSEEGVRLRPVLNLLDEAERKRLPVLGICLGHQLLGTWAGGKVAKLPAKVVGFKDVRLNQRCEIFRSLKEDALQTFQYHEDYLRKLPGNCEVLATSETCEVEAFRVRGHMMWGVQFHPEVLRSDGEAIFDGQLPPLHPWDYRHDVKGPYIIKDFAEICVNSLGLVTP